MFPGNYVQHIKQEEEEKRRRRREESDKTIDEIIDLDSAFGFGVGVKKSIVDPSPGLARQRQGCRGSKSICEIALTLGRFDLILNGHDMAIGLNQYP